MKIDISSIISDHLASLHDAGSKRVSLFDLALFYILPLGAGAISYVLELHVGVEAYNVSITFFGIFIALLLNIQVAIFSIFQRKWQLSADPRIATLQKKTITLRKAILTELNANLSYLVLVCCLALFGALSSYIGSWTSGVAPSIMLFLYVHFLLVLLMVVKRSHALFHKEYRDSPSDDLA